MAKFAFRGVIQRAIWVAVSGCAGFAFGQPTSGNSPVKMALPDLPPWEGSALEGTGQDPLPLEAVPFHGEIPWEQSLGIVPVPGLEGEHYVVLERNGRIWHLDGLTGERNLMWKLEIPEEVPHQVRGVRGPLGARFHPDYPEVPEFYLRSAFNTETSGYNWLTRFTMDPENPLVLDPEKEELILEWEAIGHRGGDLHFGPDGMLYISSGDGSTPGDPTNVGQETDNLLGSILRIDVSRRGGEKAYCVPDDNPWVGVDGIHPEVWAYGLRNPWRMVFRPGTNEIWLGDNGDEDWEMVHRVIGGENFGWSTFEGSHPFRPSNPLAGPNPTHTLPVVEQSHQELRSVIGGVWYEGTQFPELKWHYLYGCHLTQKIWAFSMEGEEVVGLRRVADLGGQVVSFAETPDREVIIAALDQGLFKLRRAPERTLEPIPNRLSETGLFTSTVDHIVSPGFLPYEVNHPVYWDGADADRFVAVRLDQEKVQIQIIPPAVKGKNELENARTLAGVDRWKLPSSSVLMQTLSLDGRRVETQISLKDGGEWRYLSYRWADDQRDAELVPEEGADWEMTLQDGSHQRWRFPGRAECTACHTQRGMFGLSLTIGQLNREFDYAALGGGVHNQVEVMRELGWFQNAKVVRDLNEHKSLPSLHDGSACLEDRARVYLHVNCAHCHRETGLGGRASFQLINWLPNEETGIINGRPLVGLPGVPLNKARLVAPGDPERSEIYRRISTVEFGKMPLLGNHHTVDEEGAELVREWIKSMEPLSANPTIGAPANDTVTE
ncbi:MAG: PQQ-dependent sugar dehydrogenase [Verrucomicrobiota bacterium]